MASYGVFLAACGFEYHGPKGHLGFAPRLTPEEFRAAFVAAEGWGSYTQKIDGKGISATIVPVHGRLKLNTLSLGVTPGTKIVSVHAQLAGADLALTFEQSGDQLDLQLGGTITVESGAVLSVHATS